MTSLSSHEAALYLDGDRIEAGLRAAVESIDRMLNSYGMESSIPECLEALEDEGKVSFAYAEANNAFLRAYGPFLAERLLGEELLAAIDAEARAQMDHEHTVTRVDVIRQLLGEALNTRAAIMAALDKS